MSALLKIVSFNMRTDIKSDGINAYPNRRGRIKEFIDGAGADIIGFQEIMPHMREWLVETFPDYYMLGVGRGPRYNDETALIAFRKDKMALLSCDTVMLSNTPTVFGSRYDGSDQSCCPREYTKALLKHKDIDEPFYVYNVHTDHVGVVARMLASAQILQDINSHSKKVFFTGDFNATPDAESIKMLEENSARPLKDATPNVDTFHNYGRNEERKKDTSKIDYIFADADTKVVSSEVYNDVPVDGVYVSDHYPIIAVFEV